MNSVIEVSWVEDKFHWRDFGKLPEEVGFEFNLMRVFLVAVQKENCFGDVIGHS